MHPLSDHGRVVLENPDDAFNRYVEIALQSGIPERVIEQFADRIRNHPPGVAGNIEPDRLLRDGVSIDTALGTWRVYETPGHAPSHICLHQPEQRLLISGDHLLGRISLYFDFGWTPDPVREFLASLDTVGALGARLCMAGHGRTFTDVDAHIEGSRSLVHERLAATRAALRDRPRTALSAVPSVFGEQLTPLTAGWRLSETLCYLTHLELLGEVVRERSGSVDRWRLA